MSEARKSQEIRELCFVCNENFLFTEFSTVSFGKYGTFDADELIGQPYGLSYDILDKKLKALPPKSMQEVGMLLKPSMLIHVKGYLRRGDGSDK